MSESVEEWIRREAVADGVSAEFITEKLREIEAMS